MSIIHSLRFAALSLLRGVAFGGLMVWFLGLGARAQAPEGFWVQLEAHATLRTAQEFAARYDGRLGMVFGFRLAGGWYGLALGPFATWDEAEAARARLVAGRQIRRDAYVTDGSIYGARFWPAGVPNEPFAAGAPQAQSTQAQEPARQNVAVPGTVQTTTDANRTAGAAAVAARPEASREAAAGAPAAAPARDERAARAEQSAEEREETLAEARAAEMRLSQEERRALQAALQWFGYYPQMLDGVFGPATRWAIERWQADNGQAPTGFLTSRQRAELLAAYEDARRRFGFALIRDEAAGIEIELPLGLVAFNRYDPPFVHYDQVGESGLRVLLISQEGTQSTLAGLYEIMQSLPFIPPDGERERRATSFLLTGRDGELRAHAEARLERGAIKGFVLIWTAPADADAEVVLPRLRASFRAIPGVLTSGFGEGALSVERAALLSGLEPPEPKRRRSGFFVDPAGTIVTAAEAVEGCGRVTIDESFPVRVQVLDQALGLAILTPDDRLAPLTYAHFAESPPSQGVEVRASGFSFEAKLNRPLLTLGALITSEGLVLEKARMVLSLAAQDGDIGGPIFDAFGAVIGMVLPRTLENGRVLPADVVLALSAQEIVSALSRAGFNPIRSEGRVPSAPLPRERQARLAAEMTVLVSCWP